MKTQIIDKDLGMENIVRSFKHVHGSYVKVGLQGQTGQKTYGTKWDTVTVVDLGVIHEFGATVRKETYSITIPERSFLRNTFDENFLKWRKYTTEVFFDMLTRYFASNYMTALSKALDLIGFRLVSDIKMRIRQGIPPPNAPSVYARKLAKGKGVGTPVPLIDTGRMMNSITHVKVIK